MVFNIVQLLLLVITLLMNYDEGYVFQCPHHAQWNLRAKEMCKATEKYYCLFDDNNKQYIDFCRESYNFEKSGYKLLVVGDLQREICHSNRYQPIQFWSNGSSDCILSKSTCNEEGQLIFHNGTNVGDRACRCDYTKGYDFVNTPTNRCFVIPLEGDCSCYLKHCDAEQILTPDYRCVNTSEWKPPFICSIKTFIQSSVTTPPDQKRLLLTFTATHKLPGLHDYRLDCVVVLCAVILVFIALGIFVIVREFLIREVALKEVENIEMKIKIFTEDKKIEINANSRTTADIWKQRLAYFLPTRASDDIFECVRLHQCVLITGPPGSGKTAIAYHIAFELQNTEGYSVETVILPCEVFKLESATYHDKHVLIIDDVIGKNTISNYNVETMRNAIKTTLQQNSNIKIIMTCRSHIYKMNDFVGYFFYHCDMLLSTMQLSINERRTMIERYLGDDFKLQIEDNVLTLYNFFPSLCELAVNEKENLEAFLTYPFIFLKNAISTYRANSDVLYLVLAIIVIANNNIQKSIFSIQDEGYNTVLQDICQESDFVQLPIKSFLYTTLESLKGTLIHETVDTFSLLNNKLFDIISFEVGKFFKKCILKHGNTTFISNRIQLTSLKQSFDLFTILVPSELEDLYFTRKLNDLKHGYVRNSLDNRQMQFMEYRSKILLCLQENEKELKRVKDVKDGSSVLHVIASLGYDDLLVNLMKRNPPDVNNIDSQSRTVLHVACLQPNNNIVKTLLSCKAKVNQQDCEGRTALHLACTKGLYDIALILIENGARINIAENKGLTPLHLATIEGHDPCVKLLIEKKADINCEDKTGNTALFIACEKHKENIIKVLVDQYYTLKQSTKIFSSLNKACQQENEDVVKELVKHCPEMKLISREGSTPLQIACEKNNYNIVKVLLQSNVNDLADTKCTDKAKRTPLHIACKNNNQNIASVLIMSQAEINAIDKYGRTPLFFACMSGNMHLIKLLIDNGADINTRDKKSMLASTVALENGFRDVAEFLKNGNSSMQQL